MFKPGQKLTDLIKGMKVQNKEGTEVPVGQLFSGKPGILVFVRHFNCFLCRDQMKAINSQLEKIEEQKVGLSIISCGQATRIQSLADELQVPSHNIYVDPSRQLYSALGLKTASGLGDIKGKGEKAEDIRQGFFGVLGGFCWSFWKMARVGKQGNPLQLGGTYVVDTQGTVLFSHVDQSGQDIVSVKQLIELAQGHGQQ